MHAFFSLPILIRIIILQFQTTSLPSVVVFLTYARISLVFGLVNGLVAGISSTFCCWGLLRQSPDAVMNAQRSCTG
eukprot:2682283-Ditylum_brightwellii.AAC.1